VRPIPIIYRAAFSAKEAASVGNVDQRVPSELRTLLITSDCDSDGGSVLPSTSMSALPLNPTIATIPPPVPDGGWLDELDLAKLRGHCT
jgi:hypothetical protein